jgi:polyisoprenoid-binding protein YceI
MSSASSRLLLLLAWLAPLFVLGETRLTGEPTAQFQGRGPAGFSVQGTGHEIRLQDDGTALRVIVPLAQHKTGVALRDRHMREKYLEVDRYPDAVLEVPWSSVRLPADGQRLEGTGTGTMTLHGQSREVPFRYTIARAGTRYQVAGSAPVNLKDFGIEIPSYFGVTVQPDIATTVTFTAERP